jgi:NAD(P)-dependent dehydrogenase (short-subunit alcohol dehydrogenase family)
MACPESTTEDGFETQFGTNHLAHFLLFQLLKPTLLASSTPEFNSRVVALSSLGHRSATVQFDDLDFKKQGYQPFVAYGQSKTANIWMANEIERRFGAQGLHAMSVHPGGARLAVSCHLRIRLQSHCWQL